MKSKEESTKAKDGAERLHSSFGERLPSVFCFVIAMLPLVFLITWTQTESIHLKKSNASRERNRWLRLAVTLSSFSASLEVLRKKRARNAKNKKPWNEYWMKPPHSKAPFSFASAPAYESWPASQTGVPFMLMRVVKRTVWIKHLKLSHFRVIYRTEMCFSSSLAERERGSAASPDEQREARNVA